MTLSHTAVSVDEGVNIPRRTSRLSRLGHWFLVLPPVIAVPLAGGVFAIALFLVLRLVLITFALNSY